jgi:hypothetical protein
MPVDVTEIVNFLLSAGGALLMLLLSVAAYQAAAWFKRKTGVDLDESARRVINGAIERAVHYATGEIRSRLQTDGRTELQIRNEIVATAVGYLAKTVPGTLKHFGITEETLADMVKARIPQWLPREIAAPSSASPDPVAPSSLSR